jgi:diacylglycerol kinase family enzyme
MPDYLLVANPAARSGKNAARIARVQSLLEKAGAACELFETRAQGATIPALATHLSQKSHYQAVLAMGGDGTFREVGSALFRSGLAEQLPLGMLPTGTANDQGRSFGLSAADSALKDNLRIVLQGKETRLDLGLLRAFDNEHEVASAEFFDSFGLGLSARVLSARNRDVEAVAQWGPLRELYRDQWVYAGAFIRTFLESYVEDDKFRVRLQVDGREVVWDGLIDFIVKATRVYAGAWILVPECRHDDGLFEIVPVKGKRELASRAIATLESNPVREEYLSELGVEFSKHAKGTHLVIEPIANARVPVFAQMDGEEFRPAKSYRIDVVPRALRLIVP